jgi:hypothetical protein
LREISSNELTGADLNAEPGEEVIDIGKIHQPDLLNFPFFSHSSEMDLLSEEKMKT